MRALFAELSVFPRGSIGHEHRVSRMDVDVDEILAASKSQRKSTDVDKDVELQFDLGNLLATDLNSLDTEALK